MVTLKSSLLNLFTKECLVDTMKSSLLKLFTRVPSGYVEVITSKAVNKGA